MRLGLPITHIEYEYSQKMIQAAREFVAETGNDFLLFVSKQPAATESEFAYQEWAVSKFFNSANIDGLLVPASALCRFISESEMISMIKQYSKSIPTVSIVAGVEGVPSLLVDQTVAFKFMVQHLIETHGCRRFAFMGIECKSEDILSRYKIFKEVLGEHDIQFDKSHLFFGDYTVISASTALRGRYKSKREIDFDAIVCVTDEMALGCLEFLKTIGVSVPEEVKVTGFDNTFRSIYFYPSISSVDQRVHDQVIIGSSMLRDLVNKKKVPMTSTIESKCCLRASCGCLSKQETRCISIDENGERALRGEDFFNAAASIFFEHKDQSLRILDFIEELQCNLSLGRLAERLENHLFNFDIAQTTICLYEKPKPVLPGEEYNLPDRARIYYAGSNDGGLRIIDSKEYFDCSERILPKEMLEKFHGLQIVKMIYHGEFHYGYMISVLGNFDCASYQLIFSMLSKFIAAAYEVSLSEADRNHLKQMNMSLSKLSKTDELTGILNRRGFLVAAQHEVDLAVSIGKTGLLIFGDIDGLKTINDTYGHDAGDRAIIAEVALLKQTFRKSDTIGRIGGDEFVILSVSLTFEFFEKLKKRLDSLCKEWNKDTGEPFSLSISLGAVEFGSDSHDLVDLMKKADAEQYKEKRARKEKLKAAASQKNK